MAPKHLRHAIWTALFLALGAVIGALAVTKPGLGAAAIAAIVAAADLGLASYLSQSVRP